VHYFDIYGFYHGTRNLKYFLIWQLVYTINMRLTSELSGEIPRSHNLEGETKSLKVDVYRTVSSLHLGVQGEGSYYFGLN
jgi:hypothetical protein